MPDWIPKNHDEFLAKFTQYKNWVTLNGAAHGFTPGDITALGTMLTALTTKLAAKHSADSAALAANADLATEETLVETTWRAGAKRLQADPTITDTDRANAGITIPDRIRTAKVAGPEIPDVFVELSPGVVTIHWGTNAHDELHNGKPDWASGAEVYLKVNDGQWFLAGFDRASPFRYLVTSGPVSLSIQVAYRATDEGDIGGKSAVVTVSTGA